MSPKQDADAAKPDRNYIVALIGLAITIVLQVSTAFWWASSITTELKALKSDFEEVRKLGVQVSRLEQRLQATEAWIAEFKPLQIEFIRGIERLNGLYSIMSSQQHERPNGALKAIPGSN